MPEIPAADTIFAQATAQGQAGVAILRISGPRAWQAVRALTGTLPEPRRASLRRLRQGGAVIDQALVLLFEPGASFTGEELAELQVHGSLAVTRRLIAVLGGMEGLRLAEPGEFTRRALMNDRMDLAQVEGLSDLIAAETEAQRLQALRLLDGALGEKVAQWRQMLVSANALLAASIDFADEEVPEGLEAEIVTLLSDLIADLRTELAGVGAAERIRSGLEVALIGPPNAGKSTLLNALAGREAAITSEIAGTTRDVIEVRMEIAGLAVTLLDTAGLRETSDPVESIGVDRARRRAAAADLRLILGDPGPGVVVMEHDIRIAAKADLGAAGPGLPVSALTGQGVAELLDQIGVRLSARVAGSSTVTNARHRAMLVSALSRLEPAVAGLRAGDALPELVAEDLRSAGLALDRLVGRVGVEDILGEIFTRFCMGK